MKNQPTPPVTALEYLTVELPYAQSPDYRTLGEENWSLVAVYETALPPQGEGKPPFQGRAFVFTRPKV